MSISNNEKRDWWVTIISLICILPLGFVVYLVLDLGFPSDYFSATLILILAAVILSLLYLAIHGKRSKLYKLYETIASFTPWW